MSRLGIFCPNTPGHVNPMLALAQALRSRGHDCVFFLLGTAPSTVPRAGFEVSDVGGTLYPSADYYADLRQLGVLSERRGIKHLFKMGERAAEAVLRNGPDLARAAGIDGLVVDQVSFTAGTIADELGLPFITVCNALLLHDDPIVPPFFTHWRPGPGWIQRLKIQLSWAGFLRLYQGILDAINERRTSAGLPRLREISASWSKRLQISQQVEAFEFPRSSTPDILRYVGPLRNPEGDTEIEFPWDKRDGRPLIYASLGTLQNRMESTFRMIGEACAQLDSEAQAVISTGHGLDPAALADLPGNPIIVPYAPQRELMKQAALVVTHGGLNTSLDALSAGVPLVAMPVTSEQPGIAARIAWSGAGESIRLDQATPQRLRALINRVRAEPAYRERARRIQSSIQAAGGVARAAELAEAALSLRVASA